MDKPRWWKQPDASIHEDVTAIADWLWNEQEPFRTRCQTNLSLFEGRKLAGLDASAYLAAGRLEEPGEFSEYYWNVPRSLVNAVTAKIAGRQKPKPALVCSDADWQTKRRAKKLERFCEAQLHQRQGLYRDAWELSTRVFLDAAVFGFGVIKVFADIDGRRVALERFMPWKLLVDPTEANNGEPVNYFTVTHYDQDNLLERFPDKEEAIRGAKLDDPEFWGKGRRAAQSVKVYEAWRMPIGAKPGKHVICTNAGVLHVEDWTRDEPPFVVLRWSPELIGFGATSLVDESATIADEVNYTLERMREGERLMTSAAIVYFENTVDDKDLDSNEIGIRIPVKANAPGLPNFINPQGYSASTMEWLQMNFGKAYELTGVSQMSASSRKEPGVTAGVALRTIAAMETERFSLIYSAYEKMVAVDIPRHQLECTRELATVHKDFALRWPGKKFLQSFEWANVSLDEDQYFIQPEAVSGITHSAADNLQLGQDLFNAGVIGPDAFLRIIQFKDSEGELNRQGDQYAVVEKYIERWLDATPEAVDSGEFVYRAPIPWMDHTAAILQVGRAYMVHELEGAPDFNLEFFRQFMSDCDTQIQKIAQQQAELAAIAQGAPPPGAAPPGAAAPPPVPMVN